MCAEKAGPADRSGQSEAFADPFATDGSPMRVLAVDVVPAVVDMIRSRTGAEVVVAPFASLTLALLAKWTPDIVVAPLVGAGFDIVDIGQRLVKLSFGGRLYALADPVPDTAAIIGELRDLCPELEFDIIRLRSD